ncbi:response regulator transcription factor [Clostridium swellfunianum]|uniref:response regulator transcription factor n=1 Tax=Clostridium swellfunianum TaxID=1367462 RepID=UPI00202E739D|nr:response regulator transcription factor [Clostridium swellfunianum]MCM0650492.1 response regulator transcription factor [Clostridium swellfunianum]
MNNILVIEDEVNVSEVIKAYLEKEGYRVYLSNNGLKGLELFNTIDFKLVILDLMLPGISGEEVCRAIREKSQVHIFMLTAKGALEDKIEGLNIGADEYLVKPFSPRELTARVNALFRRINTAEVPELIFDEGRLIIDSDKREVKLEGEDISLTPNEFDILHVLASNRGKVFTREQLIEKTMGYDFEGFDRTIDVHVKNLRKKLKEDRKQPKYIITVFGIGYKFGTD